MRRSVTRVVCFVLFIGLMSFGWIGASEARPRHRTIHVTTTDDAVFPTCVSPSYCALRSAINEAHSGDKIVVPAGTYHLAVSDGTLSVNKRLTIRGAGEGATTIIGNVKGQSSFTFPVFTLGADANVTFQKLTITGGGSTGSGGGIDSELGGTMKLISVEVTANTAQTFGGGINSFLGAVSIKNSRISFNSAGQYGGGINSSSLKLSVVGSDIDGNTALAFDGGGIHNVGTATISHSRVNDNLAGVEGGGVATALNDTTTITSSIISGNKAVNFGGGVYNLGTTNVSKSALADNTAGSAGGDGGGGLLSGGGTVTMTASTLNNNNGYAGGGALISAGSFNLLNSTVAENDATNSTGGGVLEIAAIANLISDTIAKNSAAVEGGGIEGSGGTINMRATVIGENSGVDPDCNATPPPVSQGFNFVEDEGSNCAITPASHDNLNSHDDPNLGGLAFNGGPTETMALPKHGSAAVRLDAHDPTCNGHTRDQRGHHRPRHRCDSGAFQVTK